MKIQDIQNFSLKDIVLISSLPDMGKVGGIVTQHLKKKLQTKQACKIILSDKPWINQKNGIIDVPHDEYTISVNKEKTVVIFTGENQPQEANTVIEMAERVYSEISKMGNLKLIISTGGYLPVEQGTGERVFGIGTSEKVMEQIKSYNIYPLGSDVNSITWFNGLILGQAKKHNIDPKNIETHFALLKRTAKKNNVEVFRVTSGPKKTENALNLLLKAVYNISQKRFIKNRLACKGCEFYKTEHCK